MSSGVSATCAELVAQACIVPLLPPSALAPVPLSKSMLKVPLLAPEPSLPAPLEPPLLGPPLPATTLGEPEQPSASSAPLSSEIDRNFNDLLMVFSTRPAIDLPAAAVI